MRRHVMRRLVARPHVGSGEPLTPDHGYPARIIVPAAPGVLNTKWVARMTFGEL
ncbi:molybdopterin-dependent oxidoreductase [Streptomyces canus]|uniref:molybdopterin-dependent oxidoreductase n=1 Tax=Streptomyces canus TaxID=58343 RepID=UPI0030E00F91